MGEARLLYIDDDGVTTFTTLPNVDGLNGVTLMRTITITVTDAQIKAMPTTAILMAAAPGAGKVIVPVLGTASLTWAADYTNINASAGGGFKYGSGGYAAAPISETNGDVTVLLANGSSSVTLFPALAFADSPYISGASFSRTDLVNQAVNFQIGNINSGDFTGGNAGNSMVVTLYYAVIDA